MKAKKDLLVELIAVHDLKKDLWSSNEAIFLLNLILCEPLLKGHEI